MQLILSLVAEAKRHIGHRFITLGLDFVKVVRQSCLIYIYISTWVYQIAV